ncbi:WXG100 family type VII secretion target [Prauserella cavernicola]|uniref:WXG100 family type VII secretion target n=1 Tax=Prauserella cavernicola TaxID=2800127 RepID=A0A934QX60_9PSEU|nr:hypothetical protein [Prauserella cavernicola]MBK1787787.1 hypothetical protein [Prauserella cavernicola]
MTMFDVNHDGYLDLNEQLYRAVGQLGDVLERLNNRLRNIPEATWGSAQPIWLESQNQWNSAYQQMTQDINAKAVSSVNIHQIFKDGDTQGGRIFLG